jgi:hypothetical protein
MQKIKYNSCIHIKFLISSYLTNNSLLGERVFRSWFENKIIIGVTTLGKYAKMQQKFPDDLNLQRHLQATRIWYIISY